MDQDVLDEEGPAEENILLKVKRKILEEPENFGMQDFVGDPYDCGVHEPSKNTCGTAHCIAGWVVYLKTGIDYSDSWSINFDAGAAEIIGLPYTPSFGTHPLFYTEDWPSDLAEAYFACSTNEDAAKVAAAAIDRFLADPENFKR